METETLYLTDSYKKTCKSTVLDVFKEGNQDVVILDKTVFYPFGGGQPSDQGIIESKSSEFQVDQVLIKEGRIKHLGKLNGKLKSGDKVECAIDWKRRYSNMRVHSAGHVLHEAVKLIFPEIVPIEGEHGKKSYIKYKGNIEDLSENIIFSKANELVKKSLPIYTEFVDLEELKRRSPWVPEHLPTNKPLRIMWIGDFAPIPDGGTQVANTSEILSFTSIQIVTDSGETYVHYKIEQSLDNKVESNKNEHINTFSDLNLSNREDLINIKNQAIARISECGSLSELEEIRIDLFGRSGSFTTTSKNITNISTNEKKQYGITLNEVKNTIENLITEKKNELNSNTRVWFDPTIPSEKNKLGHLHMVTRAIDEISSVFEKIGFTRVRYPEVEYDYFAFGALNFPDNHPARDDWETFFVDEPNSNKYGPMLLTPHTSSGQIREMLKNKPPIRMINIAKTYRRQMDVSHYPMFHQFEGLVVDKNISITHLRGTIDHFAKNFFGEKRETRLRPYHFQFTEPSFEVDISCNVCMGKGCKLCKEGWLEIGGAGMVHPQVLKNCGVDSKIYSGFAFGWGVERTYMMKSGLSVPDIRLLYSSDLRVLSQL
jgi:phenylalanyl-tRNA synthetase alpha chain